MLFKLSPLPQYPPTPPACIHPAPAHSFPNAPPGPSHQQSRRQPGFLPCQYRPSLIPSTHAGAPPLSGGRCLDASAGCAWPSSLRTRGGSCRFAEPDVRRARGPPSAFGSGHVPLEESGRRSVRVGEAAWSSLAHCAAGAVGGGFQPASPLVGAETVWVPDDPSRVMLGRAVDGNFQATRRPRPRARLVLGGSGHGRRVAVALTVAVDG